MEQKIVNYEENIIKDDATGTHEELGDKKVIIYKYGKYNIKIELTSKNEFIGIKEIDINKEFLTYKQNIEKQGYLDVEEYYEENKK